MDIQPAEISAILKREIQNFGADAEVSEVGEVLSASATASPASMAWTMSRPARWSSFPAASRAWR